MTKQLMDGAAGAPEAETPAERVTLRVPPHLAAPSHALVLREGPKPTRPRNRVPRVAWRRALTRDFPLVTQEQAAILRAPGLTSPIRHQQLATRITPL